MITLASNSIRRKELLEKAGYQVKVLHNGFDESVVEYKNPIQYVLTTSFMKLPIPLSTNETILSADTIVVIDNKALGKPMDHEDAFRMLKLLSGKTHQVITGVSIYQSGTITSFFDIANVTLKNLSEQEITDYVSTGEPLDKAGSYGIQGLGKSLVSDYTGDVETIIGLPVRLVNKYFEK